VKHTSPTLLVIAALAAAPGMHALSVKDDDLSLGLKLQLQVRAEKGWSQGNDNQAYNVPEAAANSESDVMDFYVRRARIGFAGTWKGEYKFAYLMRTDNQDKNSGSSTSGTAGRTPQTHYAFIERIIKQEDLGLEHGVRMGLDYAWFNGASAAFSSSSFLFPTERATAGMVGPRGVGVGYKLSHKMVTWGVDVQNNTGDNQNAAGEGTANQGEGLFMGSRVQVIAFDSDEKGHMKTVESFLGKDGKGVLISAEYGINDSNNTSATQTVNQNAYGFEILGHMDAITALAEWRQVITRTKNNVIADDTNVGTCYLFQIGYALPMGDQVLEPAFRWTKLDADADIGETGNYGTSEYGGSGYSWDLGLNYYIHGHSNKLQVAWQHWRAEDGVMLGNPSEYVAAKADVLRFQWGLSF
jgi:hypothetical protein